MVLAGQGGAAKFIQEGKYKYIPYNKLFRRTEIIEIEGYGKFEGYANRDSLRAIVLFMVLKIFQLCLEEHLGKLVFVGLGMSLFNSV